MAMRHIFSGYIRKASDREKMIANLEERILLELAGRNAAMHVRTFREFDEGNDRGIGKL